jgi:hypothetical protein
MSKMSSKYKPADTWLDHDWALFESWIRGVLHSNVVTVTFTKKDGGERVMRCTLDPERLPPPVPLAEGKKPRAEPKTAVRVFDLDLSEWRSFIPSSVKNVTFSLADEVVQFPTGPKP